VGCGDRKVIPALIYKYIYNSHIWCINRQATSVIVFLATFRVQTASKSTTGAAMTSGAKRRSTRRPRESEAAVPLATAALKGKTTRSGKRERVLVEFSESLLRRTDEAARRMEKNRSELIRTAVEKLLEFEEKQKLEADLAAGYAANAGTNLDLAEEFAWVDREGL
jgi:predicted transcriptional regulator